MYVKSYRLKRCVFSSLLKTRMSGSARMCSGNEFHAAGPACEKARSPNFLYVAAVVRSQSTTLTSDVDPRVVGWALNDCKLQSGGKGKGKGIKLRPI